MGVSHVHYKVGEMRKGVKINHSFLKIYSYINFKIAKVIFLPT